MKPLQTREFYDFASFRLDVKKRRLMKLDDGEIVPLTPKEFDVLFLLVENQPRTIEKDELLEAIWSDTFVEEATLTRNVSWLRKKLAAHDDGNETKFIETVPKRGYRFLPEVVKTVEDLPAVQSGNLIVVEEEIIQQIQIEEIIEISPARFDSNYDGKLYESNARAFPDSNVKALPAAPARLSVSPVWILPALLVFAALAFFAYRGIAEGNRTSVILASKIAPFSGLPGREESPSFSPDGKQLVYAWDGGIGGGNLDIYIKLVGAGEPVRLTQDTADEINPTFSPDGKSIAFLRVFPAHNEIILIPALGGAERKLDDRASFASFSFSRDGTSLAAASLDFSQNAAGIYLANLASGEKTRVTTPENHAVDLSPRYSPDGKSIAFIRYFSSFKREIFIVPANGGTPREITFDDVRVYGLDWSGDGESLFFTSFRVGGQPNLWRVAANGKGEPQMVATNGKNPDSLAVAPDGRTIAFVEETADENIWEIRGETRRPLIRSTRADHSPQFSPDGTKIVFASDRTGNYEIWLADADGKNQRQLTDSKTSAGSPRFSPDGKSIVFDAQIADKSDIYLISVNGGTPRRLTETGKNNSLPAWSADGAEIFFISDRGGDDQIWKMSANGGDAVQITKQGAFEMFATPDGKTVIYSKGGGKSGLWRVGTDGTDEKAISELNAAGAWRSWTVAAHGVYYTAFANQPPYEINFYDFVSNHTKEISKIEHPPLLYYANLSVSADGEKILYSRDDQSVSSIILAELNN